MQYILCGRINALPDGRMIVQEVIRWHALLWLVWPALANSSIGRMVWIHQIGLQKG